MPTQTQTLRAPPPITAIVGWLIPGGGFWVIGQRARALTVGITILSLFLLGILIGGLKVVDTPELFTGKSTFAAVLEKPWYIGQFFAGPIALLSGRIAKSNSVLPSHSRVQEIGTLYTAIAGMLNLLALLDATYRSAGYGDES